MLLRVGDDVTTHQNSEILADQRIDIFGDYANADPHFGTTMVLRGRIDRRLRRRRGREHRPPGRHLHAVDGDPVADRHADRGNTDVDTIQFGDPSGIAGGDDARQRTATSSSARRRARPAAATHAGDARPRLVATTARTASSSTTCSRRRRRDAGDSAVDTAPATR